MVCFYSFVLAQASGMPALMALFMKPFGDVAGLASGVQNLLRTTISTGIAAIGTKITQRYGPSGLLATMGGCLAGSVLWGGCFLGCARDEAPPRAMREHEAPRVGAVLNRHALRGVGA